MQVLEKNSLPSEIFKLNLIYLFYADDLLVVCNTKDTLAKAIALIEDWCQRNGMTLNQKKSGITFAPRIAKTIPFMCISRTVRINKKGKKITSRFWIPDVPIFVISLSAPNISI